MRIHIATDHAGLEFSRTLVDHLTNGGHEVVDHGPEVYDALDDYPAFCIRAALVWSMDTALLARQHNDANVISIGARQHTVEEAIRYIDAFIAEPFSGDERHARRIAQLAEYEATGDIAGKGVDVAPRAEAPTE